MNLNNRNYNISQISHRQTIYDNQPQNPPEPEDPNEMIDHYHGMEASNIITGSVALIVIIFLVWLTIKIFNIIKCNDKILLFSMITQTLA